jgi:hypothetical protein
MHMYDIHLQMRIPMMELTTLLSSLTRRYSGLLQVSAWGETSLFYNPDGLLKRGVYFATFKEKDGENDNASALNRNEVKFRMNFKISKASYLTRFHEPSLPARPAKGKIITPKSGRSYDATLFDTLIPHPVYGWMGWVSIINPSESSVSHIIESGLLDESYHHAVIGYGKNKAVIESDAKKSNKRTKEVDFASLNGNSAGASTLVLQDPLEKAPKKIRRK